MLTSVVRRFRSLRLRHLWLAVILIAGLYYSGFHTKFTSMKSDDSRHKDARMAVDDHSSGPGVMTHEDKSRDRLSSSRADSECSMTSYLSADQDRNEFSTAEADKLVQRFQPDWNLQLSGDNDNPWKIAAQWVSPTHVHPEHTPEMGAVLRTMSTAKITEATTTFGKGHNFKLMLTLDGGQRALFKMRTYSREHVRNRSICFVKDSNVGDIIAFHLSRILGFRKTPLAVGRTLDIYKEIIPVASPDLLKWIKITGDAVCFAKQACVTDGQLEGVVILWLPENVTLANIDPHPWGKVCLTVMRHVFVYFKPEINSTEEICREAQAWRHFRNKPALFLDLVDAAVLQYLVQNTDRQLFLGKEKYENFMVMLDNGKSFTNPEAEYEEILAPLYHCCRVRESTYRRLQRFENGTLSYVLEALTKTDPVYPLLTSLHRQAMDMRLHKVLAHIHFCICKHGRQKVLINI